MQLTSSAFQQGGAIRQRLTCQGQNISPEFAWRDAPKETNSMRETIFAGRIGVMNQEHKATPRSGTGARL